MHYMHGPSPNCGTSIPCAYVSQRPNSLHSKLPRKVMLVNKVIEKKKHQSESTRNEMKEYQTMTLHY